VSIPQWFAGQVMTADAANARHPKLVQQENDQTVTSSTTFVASEIRFTPEPNAVYWYELLLSYSAYGGTGSTATSGDFKWNWNAAGATFASFTQAYNLDAPVGFNNGSAIIFRRPANTTIRVAGGASDGSNDVILSAFDRGTFATDGTITEVVMQFAQNFSSANATILRGGNQTRMIYYRIA